MNREDSQGKGPGLSSNCKNFQMKPRTFSRIFAGIHGDHWDKHKDKTGRLSSMQPWALGSVFGLKSEMVERQEMLLAPVSAHTHTLGQAGNIWAAVPPPYWSAAQHTGLWLAADWPVCLSVLLCIPWHWHQLQSPSSFTQPIPGCGPSQQVAETGFCSQSYSELLTAISALIVVTGLQTVIDWMHPGTFCAVTCAASDLGPIVSVS